jgi:hypothetical protein
MIACDCRCHRRCVRCGRPVIEYVRGGGAVVHVDTELTDCGPVDADSSAGSEDKS